MAADEQRQLNVRVPAALLEQVATVAQVDGQPMSALVIEALTLLVERRRGDDDWQKRKQERLRRLESL